MFLKRAHPRLNNPLARGGDHSIHKTYRFWLIPSRERAVFFDIFLNFVTMTDTSYVYHFFQDKRIEIFLPGNTAKLQGKKI
jgi:hypothetical protein